MNANLRIVAALCWYAEQPYSLTRCVDSLAGYCDHLVALGGRWNGFPEINSDDHEAQETALGEACETINIDCEISYEPEWDSQVQKRAILMGEAARVGDWIFVIDGDEFISGGNPVEAKKVLAETTLDVARVFAHRIPMKYGRNIHRIYRSSTGVTVEKAHNGYVTADGRFLNGDPCFVDLEPTAEVGKHLMLAHDLSCRSETRRSARYEYGKYRRRKKIEAWI